ncbi:uncharacterized protein OCT59_008961 [Rhizophagus irregularis]|uniref:uncharacterized protein n=1 Tax=Rhizophagus irregularis TaxID=588596 RepID=UPI00332BBB4D|nr:hypothetical protein OCT59_008961 [Rhizophagus irregularis]
MNIHNFSLNNFGNNVYEPNLQTTAYDAYMPVTDVNNVISDMSNNNITISQQPNLSLPKHNQQYQQSNVSSPNA